MVWAFIFRSLIHWVNFFVWSEVLFSVYVRTELPSYVVTFHLGSFHVLEPLETAFLPSLDCPSTLVENQLAMKEWVISGLKIIFCQSYVYPFANTVLSSLLTVLWQFQNWALKDDLWVLFFKILLVILGLLCFHMDFMINLSITIERARILMGIDCTECVD